MISRARFTSAAGALRERLSACSTRRSYVVSLRAFMPHIILRISMLQSTSSVYIEKLGLQSIKTVQSFMFQDCRMS
jgi:hypothetical protein